MKKAFLLIVVLVFALMLGCNQKEKTVEVSFQDNLNVEQQENIEEKEKTPYSNQQLIEMAKRYRMAKGEYIPEFVEITEENGSMVKIHLYDVLEDHAATSDWYDIDRYTLKGNNILNEPIDFSEAEEIPELEKLVSIVKNDSHFGSGEIISLKTMISYYPVLDMTEEDYDNKIDDATDILLKDGHIYIFRIKKDADPIYFFEEVKSVDVGSWYRYYNEKSLAILSENYLILADLNDELNAPETDAKIVKDIYLEYFGESNIEKIYEKPLEGSHIPMDEWMN